MKNLPLPDKGQRSHWDESLPGFGLRVSQGGAKTWIVLHPRAKVRTQQTIGRYPLISLQEARGEARRRLAEQTLGKRSAKAISWNTASKEFLAEIGGERRASTHRQYKRVLEGMRFGATRLSDIMPDDMQKKLDGKTPEAFPAARAFFNWARRKKYVLEHPMEGMKAPAAYKARLIVQMIENQVRRRPRFGDGFLAMSVAHFASRPFGRAMSSPDSGLRCDHCGVARRASKSSPLRLYAKRAPSPANA